MRNYTVLFENQDIIAIIKPCGVAVQGGAGISNPLIDDIDRIYSKKHFLIHRLDKDTEGILIVGKTSTAAAKYSKILNSPETKKEYIALVSGNVESSSGIIKIPLEKDGRLVNAVSKYKVLEKKSDFTKLAVSIETGRMHQIRIHMAKAGHPIIGDDKYGNFKLNKELKKNMGVKKLMLAAIKLELYISPAEKKIFTCPVPEHILSFWNKL
ncbi:MAG: RNA pseudouridine synthase [Spirochaetes bacterium]|uniref:RNA pseudouridine synthase n=1 Tax=Candidatus Gallitreponema excrementavium TaxID=2840840 RepID=A0A9D9HQP6_9SPIR|nr:RNA pseudouridine synthase [Candidatus Gallitreponema excrementavium]